jgi:ribonuclease E
MPKSILIDATHAEETRVVVLNGQRVEEFDFEVLSRKQLRGNIYLAKVTRVEPSLQAAFVEYGGNRHGFLAFNEIHPDYYQIPVADREALMAELAEQAKANNEAEPSDLDDDSDDLPEDEYRLRQHLIRRYKIQEVIKRRQIMLIQVVKEERGNKGAALTTYLSLAGRYCVLMPNTARGGGISRKITNAPDRKRLKAVASSLDVPQGMGLIVRTAGAKRTKQEIKRDYDYLLRVWENIRANTLVSNAPALIYEEEDLVKRAIRDLFDKDFEAVLVEGEAGYKSAKDFIRMLMPSQARKVQLYRANAPLFTKYGVEEILSKIYSPTVPLKSGGYLVINQTEALVAIDVNSGKSTKERNIESTALKTNLEAAEESARQMRLRDLAGLVVIDFIDMDEPKNNRAVEKKLKDALSEDRARVQMGKISGFGLMEISRQRRRTGVLEGTTCICPHCEGMGRIRSTDSAALTAMRLIDLEAMQNGAGAICVRLPKDVALYILNEKQAHLANLRAEWGLKVTIEIDDDLKLLDVEITRTLHAHEVEFIAPVRPEAPALDMADDLVDEDETDEDDSEAVEAEMSDAEPSDGQNSDSQNNARGRNRRRRRRGGRERNEMTLEASESDDETDSDEAGTETDDDGTDRNPRRRRRGRRGGRRNDFEARPRDTYMWVRARTPSLDAPYVWIDPFEEQQRRFENTEPTVRPERHRPHDQVKTQDVLGDIAPYSTPAPLGQDMADAGLQPTSLVPEALRDQPARRGKRPARRGEMAPATMVTEEPANTNDAPPAAEEPVVAVSPEPKKRPSRARKAKAVPMETTPESVAVNDDIQGHIALVETPPAHVISIEPDPAELTAPAEKPKKGWWRK